MFEAVERVKPDRIVLDSLSEIRLLAQSSLRYRRQILLLKHYFARNGATVMMLDDLTTEANDKTVHSVAHGVVRLEELAPTYGAERRRLRVIKYRGQAYRGGFHDFTIKRGGVKVFPRLVAGEHKTDFARDALTSMIPELDALLGGGIERGSSALVLGPAGSGKSLLTLHFAKAAVERGEKVALFIFDEELGLLFARAKAHGDRPGRHGGDRQPVHRTARRGRTLAGRIRPPGAPCVDSAQVKTVVIDSLNGYQAAMPEEHSLLLHMHELLQYLNRQGAATFVTVAQHGLVGDMKSPVDITYLADTVILLRYFEALGRVRRAISIIKKRSGRHEDTIREYRIGRNGISIGKPLEDFQGVLRGVPTYTGVGKPLLDDGIGRSGDTIGGGRTRVINSERALILAPAGRDGPLAVSLLTGVGRLAETRSGPVDLVAGLTEGAGLAIITDEALQYADLTPLTGWIEEQAPWSDFPSSS